MGNGLKMKREMYGDYVEIQKTHDDEKDIANIAGCIRELVLAMRKSEVPVHEETIYIVVKAAPELYKGEFGEELYKLSKDRITVGLRWEGHTWEEAGGHE